MSGFRGGVLAGLVAVAAACLVVIGASAASKSHQLKSKFTKHDQALLAKKRARRCESLIARRHPALQDRPCGEGCGSSAASRLPPQPARLRARAHAGTQGGIGLKLAGIQAINVDALVPLPDPHPDGAVSPTPQPAPDASTPRSNPYMPTRDTGAAQFVQAHPSWDGRGVTVGIVDTGIDLDHPSLNTTSTGAPKIQD